MYRFSFVVVLAIMASAAEDAGAETRGVLRVGVAPIALTPESDTWLLGARVDDAVRAYNADADAHDQAHGYAPGSEMSTAPIDRSDLGVTTNFFTLAPGLEAGTRHVFVRVEAALAFGEDHRSYGLGLYPINLAVPMRRGTLTPYLSAGGSLSYLDDLRVDGEFGALSIASVTLADDCGGGPTVAPPAPAPSQEKTAMAEDMAPGASMARGARACEQSSIQLRVANDSNAASKVTVQKIELLDENGDKVAELTPRAPSRAAGSTTAIRPGTSRSPPATRSR